MVVHPVQVRLTQLAWAFPLEFTSFAIKVSPPALKEMGLAIQKNIIRDVYLIDETSNKYIMSQEQVPGGAGNNKSYKINKTW